MFQKSWVPWGINPPASSISDLWWMRRLVNKEVRFESRACMIVRVSQESWKRLSVLCHCIWTWGELPMFLTDWEMPRGSLDKMPLSSSVLSIYFKETCIYFFSMGCFCFSVVSLSSLTLCGFSIVRQSLWKSHSNMFRIFSFYHLLNIGFVSLTLLILLMWLLSLPLSEMPFSLSLLLKSNKFPFSTCFAVPSSVLPLLTMLWRFVSCFLTLLVFCCILLSLCSA